MQVEKNLKLFLMIIRIPVAVPYNYEAKTLQHLLVAW